MSEKERYSERVGIPLSERQTQGLLRISARTGQNRSQVIRRAIDVYLNVDAAKRGLQEHTKGKAAT